MHVAIAAILGLFSYSSGLLSVGNRQPSDVLQNMRGYPPLSLRIPHPFVTKVLQCPLLPSVPWCPLHHVVLIEPAPIPINEKGEDESHYRNIFLVDYVPDVDVTPKVAIELCMGKFVPGKVRIFMFDSVKKTEVIRLLQDKIVNGDFYVIHHETRKSNYHLYRNNCWRFSRNVTQEFFDRFPSAP